MELKINLESEINNINNFRYLLSKYKDFDACIRDIKISTLLGEKCLFEIEDINPTHIISFIGRKCIIGIGGNYYQEQRVSFN